eukprot:g92.t1
MRNATIGLGLVGIIAGIVGATVHFSQRQTSALIKKDGSLTSSQVMRGPYINSGSRDIGRDPDWDIEKGTWRGRKPM